MKKKCPLIKKKCLEDKCEWYIGVKGINPNTNEIIDQMSCAIPWLPILLIENTKEQRSISDSVISFRNEILKLGSNKLKINTTSIKSITEDIE